MPDPSSWKIYLSGGDYAQPAVELFLAHEPHVPGGSVLHLLEQPPVVGAAVAPATSRSPTRSVRLTVRAFGIDHPLLPPGRAILRDCFIHDPVPLGLDIRDWADMTRLTTLPEQTIGARRIDDFAERAARRTMAAVYRHFGIEQQVPFIYHGYADPARSWFALRTGYA